MNVLGSAFQTSVCTGVIWGSCSEVALPSVGLGWAWDSAFPSSPPVVGGADPIVSGEESGNMGTQGYLLASLLVSHTTPFDLLWCAQVF